jgi:hypothetical protein
MIGNRKLVLDTFCEVYDLLCPWADAEFWNIEEHLAQGKFIPGAVYLIGRKQFDLNVQAVRQLVDQAHIILSNPAEGSETLKMHCNNIWHVDDLVHANQILLIGGGDMDSSWPCLQYDSFLPKILDYEENILEISRTDEIYNKADKTYKFLFLNGRSRSHRQYLIGRFLNSNLLEQTIWSNLDSRNGPIKYLDASYEVGQYAKNINNTTADNFVKYDLFNDEWGEIYLKAEPYIDTYFSLVTETVFNYPYSFRTEKIWKPVAMGHPFIAVANRGYYRDMHRLGFKTFGHVIDESFDLIENNQDRLARIAQLVEDLCRQDLASFLKECYNVCKYNQQHLAEMRTQVRQEFPDRFFQFIHKYINE